ncbi:hypothetical protein BDV23DRAFT_192445 [Aspergillus alliaceus]|uniref:Rhodopsin domain-containing protein n=1 Tax=Petromyces alliaceus TaxID=209559 RepID=A0A5N7BQA8_PETAA|nr:hypothetical protein BDV23DRAFT_192445 [Aspergillus alliaceus]
MASNVNSWIWLAVVLLIAFLRYVSRWLQLGTPRNFQIEDITMIVVVVLYILMTVYLIEVDKHGTNGIPLDKVDQINPASIPDLIKGSKIVIAVEQLWLGVIWGCKACLLLLYSTMTSGLSQHRVVKAIGAFCALSFVLIEILFFAAWCRPFSAYWSVPPKSVQCSVYRNHLILTLAINVATDLMIMCIPLPLLIKAKLSLSKKLTLCAVFSLGVFVILCSILSKYYSISNPYGDRWVDWYVREAATAIVVANIPQTWTLFRRMFNWKSFLAQSSYPRSYSRSKYTNRLDSSTIHLSRFKGGDKSHTRSVDHTASGEHINREQPLEIWEQRQFNSPAEDDSDDNEVIYISSIPLAIQNINILRKLGSYYHFHAVSFAITEKDKNSIKPTCSFNLESDIPDLSDKVIFVTCGQTAGLGAQSVVKLVKHSPAQTYISGRNAKSAEDIIKKVVETGSSRRVSFVKCDLASLDSDSRLDVLMCNTDIMAHPPGLIQDGYKVHPCEGIIFKDLKTTQDSGPFGSWRRYGQRKLANILYALGLARRYPDLITISIPLGVVNTGLVENLDRANRWFVYATTFNQTVIPGVSQDHLENGQFYIPDGVPSNSQLDKTTQDGALAGQLWEWTRKAPEVYYD